MDMNPATQPADQLNEFTTLVRALGHPRFGGWEKSEYWVRLRDGSLVRPIFLEADDETCEDVFVSDDPRHCWQLNGTSVPSRDYDMMEIVRND